MKKRFIIIVLDGFGIGAMSDAKNHKLTDEKANTFGSILCDFPDLKLPALEKLGLMNAYGKESINMKFSNDCNFGKSKLMHFGADTFMGHQEIMGSKPIKPEITPFSNVCDEVADYLKENGHKVEIIKRANHLKYIVCDDYVTVADNLEADLGTVFNVTAPLDYIDFEKELEIGRLVRKIVKVARLVVFGGRKNTMEDLYNAEVIKEDKFIGIASAASKSYDYDYHCIHMGYGINNDVQVPTILTRNGIDCILIGKVADIVANDKGVSISCVPTVDCMNHTLATLDKVDQGFICTNIQETDLAGHLMNSKRYLEVLKQADDGINRIMNKMSEDDILLVQADHGNDPNIGYTSHTREYVPLLVYKKGLSGVELNIRETMSDSGATVLDYFKVETCENGTSFLDLINRKVI